MAVLEEDPFLIPAADLWRVEVAMTFCGGRATYRNGGAEDGH